MQLGENVGVAVIADERHDDDCYFCKAKAEPKPEENDLMDSYPEDEDLDGMDPNGLKFKNDASKLGSALGGKPQDKTALSKPSSVAAHHLIPGNGSLAKSDLYKSKLYLWVDGKEKGNIGYNVNSLPNGEWLPGNYAIRPWGKKGAAFAAAGGDPKAYAFSSMDEWRAQFHDAHEDYNVFVTGVLDKIHSKLTQGKEIWCPEAKQEEDDPTKRRPLYVLVNRLHSVSARMRRMLVFPTRNWKRNIWTSAFSAAYMDERPHQD